MADTLKLSSPATREFWEIAVLFEDEHLLALDKPAGLLTSPDRDDPARPNLMTLLHAGIAEVKPWARARGLTYLANAHRLDFETSGVILLARNKPALVALANLSGPRSRARPASLWCRMRLPRIPSRWTPGLRRTRAAPV